jgi:hypothetical protein
LIGETSEGLTFHPAQLDEADISSVSEAIRKRVLRVFQRRGLLSGEDARGMREWDHGGGFSVHGAVWVHGNDRAGRERLFRYCARPLFAAERLVWEPGEQRLRYQLPQPGHRGETVLLLTPLEFLDPGGLPAIPGATWEIFTGPSPDVLSGRSPRCVCPPDKRSRLTHRPVDIAIAILVCWRRTHPGARRSRPERA